MARTKKQRVRLKREEYKDVDEKVGKELRKKPQEDQADKSFLTEEARPVDKTLLIVIIAIFALGIIVNVGISAYKRSIETVAAPQNID